MPVLLMGLVPVVETPTLRQQKQQERCDGHIDRDPTQPWDRLRVYMALILWTSYPAVALGKVSNESR